MSNKLQCEVVAMLQERRSDGDLTCGYDDVPEPRDRSERQRH